MDCLLINLDTDAARLAHMQASFDAAGLAFLRIQAVDGRGMDEADRARWDGISPKRTGHWMKGQIGCFLSHFAAWEKAAQPGKSYTAIFEDDVHLSPETAKFLNDERWIPADADIVRLETSTNMVRLAQPTLTHEGRSIRRLRSDAWCAGAYIISQTAARRLVDVPEKEYRPADAFLFAPKWSDVAGTLRVYQISPALAVQDKYKTSGARTDFSSNIETGAHHKKAAGQIRSAKLRPSEMIKRLFGYQMLAFKE